MKNYSPILCLISILFSHDLMSSQNFSVKQFNNFIKTVLNDDVQEIKPGDYKVFLQVLDNKKTVCLVSGLPELREPFCLFGCQRVDDLLYVVPLKDTEDIFECNSRYSLFIVKNPDNYLYFYRVVRFGTKQPKGLTSSFSLFEDSRHIPPLDLDAQPPRLSNEQSKLDGN